MLGEVDPFRSLIITVSLQTAATLQFTSWCNSSWKSERTWLRFLTVSGG
jgi:hypothetical protein